MHDLPPHSKPISVSSILILSSCYRLHPSSDRPTGELFTKILEVFLVHAIVLVSLRL
jgi:hypothetical protein